MIIIFFLKKHSQEEKMKHLFIVIFLTIFFIKNINADINQDVADLKNEFKQIQKIYENKIEMMNLNLKSKDLIGSRPTPKGQTFAYLKVLAKHSYKK